MQEDHDRLDALLVAATAEPGHIEPRAFAEFRRGLLRHIGLEEKILFPAARDANGGVAPSGFDRLRKDHGHIVALLVPTPTPELVAQLRAILEPHNVFEEEPGGFYEVCEALIGARAEAVLAALRDAPEVPVRPHYDGHESSLLRQMRAEKAS